MTYFSTFLTSVVRMTPSFSSSYSSTSSRRKRFQASLISVSSSALISFSFASLERLDLDAEALDGGLDALALPLAGVLRGGFSGLVYRNHQAGLGYPPSLAIHSIKYYEGNDRPTVVGQAKAGKPERELRFTVKVKAKVKAKATAVTPP